jgi:hypothetical protein
VRLLDDPVAAHDGWASIPVAFSSGDGSFTVTNIPTSGPPFATFASQLGAKPVTGDFNNDGLADIALTGGFSSPGVPWTTIPIAFSNGDGSFHVTNIPVPTNGPAFATLATNIGAKPASGDFNNDGWSSPGFVDTADGSA